MTESINTEPARQRNTRPLLRRVAPAILSFAIILPAAAACNNGPDKAVANDSAVGTALGSFGYTETDKYGNDITGISFQWGDGACPSTPNETCTNYAEYVYGTTAIVTSVQGSKDQCDVPSSLQNFAGLDYSDQDSVLNAPNSSAVVDAVNAAHSGATVSVSYDSTQWLCKAN